MSTETTIINTTPHEITFRHDDGSEFTIEPSEYLLNARAEERVASEQNGVQFVETVFVPTDEGWRMIADIRQRYGDDCIIVGSIIAAQAYAPDVVAMTPAPGFERVSPEQKRMNPNKFTVYSSKHAPGKPGDDAVIENIRNLIEDAKQGWGYAGSPYENKAAIAAVLEERKLIVEGLKKVLESAEHAKQVAPEILRWYVDPAVRSLIKEVPWLASAVALPLQLPEEMQ